MADLCVYGTLKEELIGDRLVIDTMDKGTQMRLLRKPSLTLPEAIYIFSEQTPAQMHEIHASEAKSIHGWFQQN